ncbi:cytochrome P450 [Actinokineospora pegani]|uniref:cytochrome P450 n=1 Tax=Actinokineospora pegani TaxID=2654637 RepID=UPI0018D28D95|nr:cytochrome P450 [Actinokineospora pegani]
MGLLDRWTRDRQWPSAELAAAPAGLLAVPGDAGPPLVGYGQLPLRDPGFTVERVERHGPVSWVAAAGSRVVLVAGAEAAAELLADRGRAFSQSGWPAPHANTGLLARDGDDHLHHRRLLQEAFTADRVAAYLRRVDDIAKRDVPRWSSGPLVPRLRDLADSVTTGVLLDGASAPLAEVPARRRGNGDDLLTALCQARTPEGHMLTDADVVDHLDLLTRTAAQTLVTAVASAVLHLGRDPEWQDRARVECLSVDPPSVDRLAGLTALDLVTKEALRLAAPVPHLLRRAVRETSLQGRHIPAGTLVAFSVWATHHAPATWTEPSTFDPDRFGDGRREERAHPFAWLPFGGGAHKCLGTYFGLHEVKAVLHAILRSHRWALPREYAPQWRCSPNPLPTDNLPVVFEAV